MTFLFKLLHQYLLHTFTFTGSIQFLQIEEYKAESFVKLRSEALLISFERKRESEL